jgi:hypothetical protein
VRGFDGGVAAAPAERAIVPKRKVTATPKAGAVVHKVAGAPPARASSRAAVKAAGKKVAKTVTKTATKK